MYCKKCKKDSSLFDKYCPDCGTKLEHKKMDPATRKKFITTSIVVLVVLFVFFLGSKIIHYLNSPEYIASTYFKAVITNDVDKIYGYLDVEDSDFVSKEILIDKMDMYHNVNQFEVVSVSQVQKDIVVKILYRTNTTTNTSYIKLIKSNDLFNSYKVASGKVVHDIKIKVPTGASVLVDEVELKNPKTKNTFDYYEIDSMIKGTYHIKIAIDGITVEEDIMVEDGMTYAISNIDLESTLEEELVTKTKNELNFIYSSIINGTIFSDIKEHFIADTSKLKSSYNSIKRSIRSTISTLEFIDLEVKKVTYSSNGNLLITYLADKKATIGEEVSSYSNYITVEYKYINDTYHIYDISE